jgi:hypothetical protein
LPVLSVIFGSALALLWLLGGMIVERLTLLPLVTHSLSHQLTNVKYSGAFFTTLVTIANPIGSLYLWIHKIELKMTMPLAGRQLVRVSIG